MASRSPVVRVLEAGRALGGRLARVVGSLDLEGKGTRFDLAEVGPFVLVDDARGLDGPDLPPFGAHPHAGLVALSYVASGGPWRSRANAPGAEEIPFGAGDVLVTVAGRGAVHDERTEGPGLHEMTQIILRLPARRADVAASVTRIAPERIAPSVLRLFGPSTLAPLDLDAAAYHVVLAPGDDATITLPASQRAGFAYTRGGAAHVAGVAVTADHVAELAPDGSPLVIEASDDRGADLLLGVGAPLDEPWVKLLGHDGFVVAPSEDAARALMAAYAHERERFGQG